MFSRHLLLYCVFTGSKAVRRWVTEGNNSTGETMWVILGLKLHLLLLLVHLNGLQAVFVEVG